MITRSLVDTGPLPLSLLETHGSTPAVLADGEVLTYADLAVRVRERVAELGPTRRLVLVVAANTVDSLVTALAALCGGHVAMLGCADAVPGLVAAYAPDVVALADDGSALHEHREGTCHDLHPDLALLLSTSGSTGSPKLVRLSADNVRSNADAIASYLQLGPDDRAATTLPMHYCYGLSVVTSHLRAGASLLLTQRSVAEDELWREFCAAGATSFAGVPYTFDLLDRSGFAERELPSLRYVTQAGGRLAPDRVRHWARMGGARGFDLVVMYGQTEATARMAYLPPHLAESRAETIGIPIPGGELRVDAAPGEAVGELVYTGPNVMLGYARGPADLAMGRTVHELRTGDLARQHEDGLYEVVGRRVRFAKAYGLRIDLDRLESMLDEQGVTARAVSLQDRVVVFVRAWADAEPVTRLAASSCGLPAHAVTAHVVDAFPVLASGKPDHAALQRHAALVQTAAERPAARSADAVRDVYARVLGRPDATVDDSFAALRGDSLSYVEATVRLGELLGDLPADWPTRSPRQLATRTTAQADERATPGGPRRRLVRLETPVLLRGLAILLIVATHANVISVMGGAHVLLGLAGYNLARCQLTDAPRRTRLHNLLRAAGQVLVPAGLWIGAVGAAVGTYQPATALMLNQLLGSDTWTDQWQFWFLEALVWSTVATAAVVAVPTLDRLERGNPFAFAAGVVVMTLAVRYAMVGVQAGPTARYAVPVVAWCVALGWLAARATTTRLRFLASVAVLLSVPGFFGEPVREALLVAGLLALLWLRSVPVPRLLASGLGVVAAGSLFVYLTHWQVYPHLEDDYPVLATLASLAAGLLVWRAYQLTTRWVRRLTLRPTGHRWCEGMARAGVVSTVARPNSSVGRASPW